MIDQDTSIASLAAAYRTGAVSPVEVVDAYLSRIDEYDPKLGAFQQVFADDAREAAEAAGKAMKSGNFTGLFQGIPFALKDIVEVEGHITTGGCHAMRDHVSTQTAVIAKHLTAAGGILIGKTKTVEFAYGAWGTNQHMGTPQNPWDMATKRTPGGSSSGSAVAVSAGLAPCAIGTDTGGSVRVPAAWCGIVGLKVTEGVLSTQGILPLSHTLDTPGPLVRSVRDAAIAFDTMSGRDPLAIERDFTGGTGLYGALAEGVSGLNIGILSPSERDGTDGDILELYDEALKKLGALGPELIPIDLPVPADAIARAVGLIISAEGYFYNGRMYENADNKMDDDVRARIMAGRDISSRDYIAALNTRLSHQAQLKERMRGLSAVATPTLPTPAVPIDEVDQAGTPTKFTRFGNYFAMCGLSVPMGLTGDGLPAGLQILAPGRQEEMAIRIASAFEQQQAPIGIPPL